MARSGFPSVGLAAASLLFGLPAAAKVWAMLSVSAQLLLALIVYLVLTSEQQRRATQRFTPQTTSSRSHSSSRPDKDAICASQVAEVVFSSTDRSDYAEYIARVRNQECPALLDACYLDAAAAPPFPSGLVRRINDDLFSQLYSNPHSKSPSAVRTATAIDAIRTRVMNEIFGIRDTQEWHLVFTSGATASMKLVAEAYDWTQDSTFSCLHESHTSLLGIRDVATRAGAAFTTFDESCLPPSQTKGLVALPLQCNATGRRYTSLARTLCRSTVRAHVLLDAASYLSSSSHLNISALAQDEQPDFVAFSFYKLFGYPTGLGGLLVRASSASALSRKVYYGGGTLDAILPHTQWIRPRHDFVSRYEDGTLNFHGVLAIGHALDYYKTTFGSLFNRRAHVQSLTRKLFESMATIRHANGRRVARIYTNSIAGQCWKAERGHEIVHDDQGPIINFNIQTADGTVVPPQEVDRLASVSNIHLRMGRHCNAGFAVGQLGVTQEQLQLEYANGVSCDNSGDSDNVSTSIRASLCLINTDEDIYRLNAFIQRFFVSTALEVTPRADITESTDKQFQLDTVTVYPIKSCAGQDLLPGDRWKLTPHGLEHDREWVLLDLRNSKVLSQKRHPEMALIRPRIDLVRRVMVVCVADYPSVTIDLDDDGQYEPSGVTRARVCTDTTRPRVHKSVALRTMLSEHLGVPCTLAQQDSNNSRHSKLASSSHEKIPLLFSNESPFLLINSASLDKVSELMNLAREGSAMDVDERASDSGYSSSPESEIEVGARAASFRANFVITPANMSSDAAWTEDIASRVQIGSHTFAVLGQCRRCQMVCIDQKTGELRPETFQTLAKHRRNSRGRIIFGSHLAWMPTLHDSSTGPDDGYISVGMTVHITH